MRKLKQTLSLSLALVLSLVLTIPAFAESKTIEHPYLSSAKFTLSDTVSTELVPGVTRSYGVISVKTGTTLTVNRLSEEPAFTIREGYVNGRTYELVAGGKTLHTEVGDGVPFTLTDEQIGLWFFGDGSTPNGIFINVIAGDGSVPAQSETASPTNDKLMVDGVVQNPTVYKIGGYNYFKIRDLAAVLNGTGKQFAVGYDAATSSVTATTGQGYTKQATDLLGAPSGTATADVSNDTILVNGQTAQVEVYKIDGMNYFKLRDLGSALGFQVGWDAAKNVASIDTRG